MTMPFKCPVCDGTGLVSRPPGLAGDVATWSATNTAPWPCRACDGKGIVWAEHSVGTLAVALENYTPEPPGDEERQ